MAEIVSLYVQIDAAVLATITALVALLALTRKRRPITRSRVMDVVTSAILLVFLGIRYAILTVLVLFAPQDALPGSDATTQAIFAGVFAAAAIAGVLTYRGGVPARITGACVLAAVSLSEGLANLFLLDESLGTGIDTVLSIVAAGAGVVLAAYFWTHRTATPNPLGADKRPFDY